MVKHALGRWCGLARENVRWPPNSVGFVLWGNSFRAILALTKVPSPQPKKEVLDSSNSVPIILSNGLSPLVEVSVFYFIWKLTGNVPTGHIKPALIGDSERLWNLHSTHGIFKMLWETLWDLKGVYFGENYRRQPAWVGSLSPSQEVFSGEMDGGNPSFPSTTSLVPLSHKAVPSGRAVITHFTALILITANVNIRIININAQNNAVICNYRVALIFLPSPPFASFYPPPPSSPHFNVIMRSSYFELI